MKNNKTKPNQNNEVSRKNRELKIPNQTASILLASEKNFMLSIVSVNFKSRINDH